MPLVLIYAVGTPLLLVLFVQIALPRENPLRVLWASGKALWRLSIWRSFLLVLLAVNVLNFIESPLDPRLTAWLDRDFTPWVHALEGDFVARLQRHVSAGSVLWLGAMYMPGWVALQLVVGILLAYRNQRRDLSGYLSAFLATYLLALPFYLFLPVKEVAWSGLTTAQPLLDRIRPGLSQELHFGSAIDNCFPSLHVSCAVTALWFARRIGLRTLTLLCWILTASLCWTVMALGIHWCTDVLAGIPFGIFCAWMGDRLAGRRAEVQPELAFAAADGGGESPRRLER